MSFSLLPTQLCEGLRPFNGFIKANFSGIGVLGPKRNPQPGYQRLHFVWFRHCQAWMALPVTYPSANIVFGSIEGTNLLCMMRRWWSSLCLKEIYYDKSAGSLNSATKMSSIARQRPANKLPRKNLSRQWPKSKSKSKSKLYYDRQSVGQSVLVSGTLMRPATSYGCVGVGRPLWREVGSVVFSCSSRSPVQLFSGLSPAGFAMASTQRQNKCWKRCFLLCPCRGYNESIIGCNQG
jgi:hypothetical protein